MTSPGAALSPTILASVLQSHSNCMLDEEPTLWGQAILISPVKALTCFRYCSNDQQASLRLPGPQQQIKAKAPEKRCHEGR